MKAVVTAAAIAVIALATPASAATVPMATWLKLAPLVLRNKALLERGQTQCGADAALKPQESLLSLAVGAAIEKALPARKFDALSLLAARQAAVASRAPSFCTRAAVQKPGMLSTIADAAGKLGVGGDLGTMAGMLGGDSGNDAVSGALSGLLGGH